MKKTLILLHKFHGLSLAIVVTAIQHGKLSHLQTRYHNILGYMIILMVANNMDVPKKTLMVLMGIGHLLILLMVLELILLLMIVWDLIHILWVMVYVQSLNFQNQL